jgi:hypothetical protein
MSGRWREGLKAIRRWTFTVDICIFEKTKVLLDEA